MPGGSEAHRSAEAVHAEGGGTVAFPHRAVWGRAQPHVPSLAVHVRDAAGGRSQALFCADRIPSRLFKGFDILRIERFGGFRDEEAARGAVRGLGAVVAREKRLARVRVELFSPDFDDLGHLSRLLEGEGYGRSAEPRCYEQTAFVDLRMPIDQVFAGLHKTARRHIRAVGKRPVEIREIHDQGLASRMETLMADTFARSGAVAAQRDWASIIGFSEAHPTLSRVVGLFRAETDGGGPEDLLAFVWGAHHGDTVEYVSGASTRAPDLKMPLSYGLMWDLIRWAHAQGATWFDMGGISAGSHDSSDPVGGISDFKRYFKPEVRTVGAEFTLDGSSVVSMVSRVVDRVRRVR